MSTDLLELYARASDWSREKVAGVTDLDGSTPCDEWTARQVLNHMLETQRYFAARGSGEDATPPNPNPPQLIGDDPVADLKQAQSDVRRAYSQEGVIEKTGPMLGIAFADQLLHGWDLAVATGQDTTMPDGLAEAAFNLLSRILTEEQRKGAFKPEVPVGADATMQQRLLAFTGRDPG